MTAAGDKKRTKELEQRFRECIREERLHLKVGKQRQDRTDVRLVGSVTDMHGAGGVCKCCFGRGA